MRSTTFLSLLALCADLALAVQPVTVKGSDLINTVTNERFQIVGVAYQPGGSSGYNPASGEDPLSDGDVCLRDAALMQQLGVNAIRVYNVDPDLNHDMCASIFNAVGIYMMIDVNSPLQGQSIDRDAPWTTYDASYLNRTFAVVEAFKSYPNTLLFFSGNEVINDVASGAIDPPYMRAVTRDLHNYIAKNSERAIPVAYSAADVRTILVDTWNYLQCTTTGDASDPSRVDIFALNSYSWCGNSSFQVSGYDTLIADFSHTSVPVFFSEFGCNVPAPRIFTEVPVIYGPLMTPVMSGGSVYQYSNEGADYGLVNINANGSVQLLPDYDTFQSQLDTLNITALQGLAPENTTIVPPACSSSLISDSGFDANFTLPAVPPGAQDIINNGVLPKPSGKLVAVTATKVTQQVENVSGTVMTGLAITPLANNASNNPGHTTSSGSGSATGSATGSAASPTKTKSAAVSVRGDRNAVAAIFVLAVGCISLF